MTWYRSPPPSKKQVKELLAGQKRRPKFLIDENLGPSVTMLLKRSGWNSTGTLELGLNGRSDQEVFRRARKLDRILITQDRDFLNDRIFDPRLNPGIVIWPKTNASRRLILSVANQTLRIVGHDRELWRNTKILITDESTWIVRTYEAGIGSVVENKYMFDHGGILHWLDS